MLVVGIKSLQGMPLINQVVGFHLEIEILLRNGEPHLISHQSRRHRKSHLILRFNTEMVRCQLILMEATCCQMAETGRLSSPGAQVCPRLPKTN